MRNACATQPFAASTCLSAQESSKRVAKPLSDPVSNSPVCSGLCGEPTPSSPCDAATSTHGLRTTGRHAVPPDLHFYVAHPPSLDQTRPSPELTPQEKADLGELTGWSAEFRVF